MGYLVLEMVVVGGEGLKEFNLSSPNMNVYVMAVLKGASFKDQNAQTNMVEGGENLSWNYPMKFYIDRSKQIEALKSQLTFTLKSKDNVDHEENIGQVIVPIVDLLRVNTIDEDSMQNVSYPIEETSKCISNGKFHFAFKFELPQVIPSPKSPMSPASQQTEISQLQKEEQEQGRAPRKHRKRLRKIATKVAMGLSITVASGYISKALFDNGQPSSSTNNHSPPSSSMDASSTFVSQNSFYDESTPIADFDSTSPLALDPATSSFYSDTPLFTTFPDTAAFDPTTSFSSGGTPLTALPDNATFPVAAVDPTTVDPTTWFYSGAPPILDNFPSNVVLLSPSSSSGLFVPPSDAARVSTNYEDGHSSLLDSVVEVLSSLF